MSPLERLQHHVSGAIARGEKEAIAEMVQHDAHVTAMENNTIITECEYTDTFSGDANYSWVRRATMRLPRGTSDAMVVRKCKAALGLTGVRGAGGWNGDMYEMRPYRTCTVMFIHFRY